MRFKTNDLDVSVSLFPIEKPDRLEAKIGPITSRTVHLLWTVLFDGNSPVLYFTVAHYTSNGTRSYNVSSSKWSYTVLYLIPATFYEFSITATNQLGTSDPVMISNTTLEAGNNSATVPKGRTQGVAFY